MAQSPLLLSAHQEPSDGRKSLQVTPRSWLATGLTPKISSSPKHTPALPKLPLELQLPSIPEKVLETKRGAGGAGDCPQGQRGQCRALRLGRGRARTGQCPGKGSQPGARCDPPGALLLLLGGKQPIRNSQFPVTNAPSAAEAASPQAGASSPGAPCGQDWLWSCHPPATPAHGNGDIRFHPIPGDRE